jgi:hypothetical protein
MEPYMNEQAPACTEKAQIVIAFQYSNMVLRFSSTKKGFKEYTTLLKAWAKWQSSKFENGKSVRLHPIDGDMFVSTIDLAGIVHVDYIDIAKRMKFVPYQG